MPVSIQTQFAFSVEQPTDVLLQFEAAAIPEQELLASETQLSDSISCARVAAQDDIGQRIWLRTEGRFEVSYTASVEVQRQLADLPNLEMLEPHDIPAEAVQYLFDSRYCEGDRLQSFAEAQFGGTSGGMRIAAIEQWLADNLTYSPGASSPSTSALDTFVERRGICRDYAHVLIALARASAIPARYVACYAPGVDPPDFHAVAEVFLNDPAVEGGGTWQLVDATRMADPAQTVKIGVGRDAADVSFLTSFGPNEFLYSQVSAQMDE